MIVMSFRHRRTDIFWFTFFHELCHVLRHSKKQTFVDMDHGGIAEELEQEADSFAGRVLIPPDLVHKLLHVRNRQDVKRFAAALDVAPGIVVGRMQHDKLIPPSQWNDLIARYKFPDEV
jgi:HTH-type transcriptional regulator/antitoxin HigA